MKLSLAIKLVTVLTIVFLLAGILSISLLALSATQMKITLGTPKAEVTETAAKITIPIQISNQGFLAIKSLTLQTIILDTNSEKLAEGETGPLDIPTKSEVEVPVSITLDFKAIKPETLRRLAFNDESFTIEIRGGLSLDPLLSLALSARTMLPWGAPISNLKVGEPTFTPRNVTHILVSVPVSFMNKSPYLAVSGQIVAKLYDEAGISQGTGVLKVDAPKGNQYQRSLELLMRLPQDAQKLLFADKTLKYRVELQAFIGETVAYTITQPIEVRWGAPLYGLQIAYPTFSQHNSTHVKAASAVSFTNHSPYLDVDTQIQERIFNITSGELKGLGAINVKAPKGASFNETSSSFIKLDSQTLSTLLFNDTILAYRVVLSGTLMDSAFTIERLLTYSWGAPILNLTLGRPVYQPLDLTHVTINLPFNFTNNSPFIKLDASIKVEFYDTAGNLVGSSSPTAFSVPSSTFYKGEITGPVKASVVAAKTIQLKMIFTTLYGTFTKEVSLVA